MIKFALVICALVVVSASWGCAGRDMDKVCAVAEEVFADESLAPELRMTMFARRVDDAISSTPVRNIMGAIASAAPEQRYALLQAGAAEVGRPDWSCPVLEEAMRPPAIRPAAEPVAVPEPALGGALDKASGALDKASGALDKASIQIVMRSATARTRRCYETELGKNPELAGRLGVDIVIGAGGKVTYAAAGDSPVGDEVAACVLDVIKTLRFPAPAAGETKVHYPFVFTAAQ